MQVPLFSNERLSSRKASAEKSSDISNNMDDPEAKWSVWLVSPANTHVTSFRVLSGSAGLLAPDNF
jgi:hypothetical protein